MLTHDKIEMLYDIFVLEIDIVIEVSASYLCWLSETTKQVH